MIFLIFSVKDSFIGKFKRLKEKGMSVAIPSEESWYLYSFPTGQLYRIHLGISGICVNGPSVGAGKYECNSPDSTVTQFVDLKSGTTT